LTYCERAGKWKEGDRALGLARPNPRKESPPREWQRALSLPPLKRGEEKMVVEFWRRKWRRRPRIRDSDGTMLSPEMLKMGLDVYSTICWCARANLAGKQQWTTSAEVPHVRSGHGPGQTAVIDPMFRLLNRPKLRH